MTTQPTVTIITASLNTLPGLKETVQGIASQTFRNYQHIVIDGGSDDGTKEWLEQGDHSLDWVSEPDGGIADALNKGLAMATGEWILVLHAEDTLLGPDSLAQAVHELQTLADVVSFDVLFVTDRGDRLIKSRGFSPKINFKTTIPHQGALVRRSLFDRIGGFRADLEVALDYEFFLRAHRHGATADIPHTTLSRMPDSGVSSRRDWPSLRSRFSEERRIHRDLSEGSAMMMIYALYWPLYMSYRRLRSAIRHSKRS